MFALGSYICTFGQNANVDWLKKTGLYAHKQ